MIPRYNNSPVWIRVSKHHPCPVCHKPDWCSISADYKVVICMRIAEGAIKQTRNGGFLHRLSNTQHRKFKIPIRLPSRQNLQDLAEYYQDQALKYYRRINAFAHKLDLPVWALKRLCIGWSENRQAYSFPMVDASGNVIGIRLRSFKGWKYAVRGSREGLFIPDKIPKSHRILICEGPTDCAALLCLDFPVIGRPSCMGGTQLVEGWVKNHAATEAVVVADADEPGRRGAWKLSGRIRLYIPSVRIIQPPEGFKDVRAWINGGATRFDINEMIRSANVLHLQVECRI